MAIDINATNFPDYAFREFLSRLGNRLDNINSLNLGSQMTSATGYGDHAVEDFTGLELLTNIISLDIASDTSAAGYLKTPQDLTLKSPSIVNLSCYECRLNSLDVSNMPKLQTLNLTGNQLKALNLDETAIVSLTGMQVPYVSGVTYTGAEDYPYQIDLRDYVGNSNVNRVVSPSAWQNVTIYDVSASVSDEISSLYTGNVLKLKSYPQAVKYRYKTTASGSVMMDVTAIMCPYIEEEASLNITKGIYYSHMFSNTLRVGNHPRGKAVKVKPTPTSNYVMYKLDASELAKNVTWSIVGGKIPDGLTLNPSTGEISGTTS